MCEFSRARGEWMGKARDGVVVSECVRDSYICWSLCGMI